MKSYPSITSTVNRELHFIAFDKLDGSNIRAEWSKKRGWYKYGTRNRLIDDSDPIFGRASRLMLDKYGDAVASVLHAKRFESAVCFFELWGPRSFAGTHDPHEDMTVTLLDVAPKNHGIMEPRAFLDSFGHLDHPRVLHEGSCTDELLTQVRNSTLPGMTFEGIVCKSANDKRTKAPIMFKHKSQAWLDKLRDHCGDDLGLFTQLM